MRKNIKKKKGKINFIDEMIEKIKKINYKNMYTEVKKYLKTNILTLTFLITSIINGIILRYMTVKNYFNFKPILGDTVILLIIIFFCYSFKPKNQFKYYMPWVIILSTLCVVNSIYYSNYISFASVSLLKTSTQLGGFTDAITTLLEPLFFIYYLQIPIFIYIHSRLKKHKYYEKVSEIENGKIRRKVTLLTIIIIAIIFVSTLTSKDLSRLKKQWDRRYTVMEFGIYTYQVNDIISSLKIKITSALDSDSGYEEFLNFYENKEDLTKKNKYTNLLNGKNVLVIHAESIQGFLMNLKFNGKELTPNINKLASEGLYFSNFYTEESIGNSSDSEFTSLTSLLPVSSGTVFVNYFNRQYNTTPSLLKEKGYYTFSMHGNVSSAWNRKNAYKYLGYDDFYSYTDSFEIDEVLGLGLSDKSFFRQSIDKIKEINQKNKNFYGTMVMLTNHTPFDSLVDSEYYTNYNVDLIDENGETINYLEGTKMGNYLKSANYADEAIGEFINNLDKNGILENTVIVLYGDHDCKLKKSEFEKLYLNENANKVMIDLNKKLDVIDDFTYEINRKVPFIIWSKEIASSEYNVEVKKVMGMVDVMPTLGNMLGIKNEFAVGNDIFNIDNNYVVFPDGSFITDKVYYDSSKDEYRQLDLNDSVNVDELVKYKESATKTISVSNNIIVHNYLKKYYENNENQLDK